MSFAVCRVRCPYMAEVHGSFKWRIYQIQRYNGCLHQLEELKYMNGLELQKLSLLGTRSVEGFQAQHGTS